MIKINSIEIVPKRFPDGTYCLLDMPMTELNGSAEMQLNNEVIFNWNFESEEEIIFLWYLINHCKAHFSKQLTYILYMRYVPGARMDRVKNKSEVFTLKYFAKLINTMGFDQVILLDPHSNVATSLFENGSAYQPITTIEQVISIAEMDGELVLYFPDEGAMKRYKDAFPKHKFLYGEKKRDWETGKILGLDGGKITKVGDNPIDVLKELLASMADEDAEIISIYYGDEVSEEDAEAIQEYAEAAYSDCDVAVLRGGQPIYYYVVSVE